MARRPSDPRAAAEAAFKSATARPERVKEAAPAPGARESVTLRIDSDVLAHFQTDGPGWQERINAALRKSIAG